MPQLWSPDGVRQERSNWRDLELSNRHRLWGFDCPMVDIDFLAIEYDRARPCALIEYKRRMVTAAPIPTLDFNAANYQALIAMADERLQPLPFAVVWYWRADPERWLFVVVPVNETGRRRNPFGKGEVAAERRYVAWLHAMRRAQPDCYLCDGSGIFDGARCFCVERAK
jgi:hypothetical protein